MRDRRAKILFWVAWLGVMAVLIMLFCRAAFGAGGEPMTAALPLPLAGVPPRAARAPIVEAILGGTVLALGVILIGAMVKRAGDE